MKKVMTVAGMGLLLAGTTPALANAEKKMEEAKEKIEETYQEAKTSVYDLLDKHSTDVTFASGSSELSDGAKSDIKSLVNAMQNDSAIESISIAAWADAEAPLRESQNLSDEQQQLAEKRLDNLEKYVKTLTDASVDRFDMSQRAGWFAKLFQTDDAVAKEVMTNSTAREESEGDRLVAAKARIFKDKGGASEAVIVVVREEASLAH